MFVDVDVVVFLECVELFLLLLEDCFDVLICCVVEGLMVVVDEFVWGYVV